MRICEYRLQLTLHRDYIDIDIAWPQPIYLGAWGPGYAWAFILYSAGLRQLSTNSWSMRKWMVSISATIAIGSSKPVQLLPPYFIYKLYACNSDLRLGWLGCSRKCDHEMVPTYIQSACSCYISILHQKVLVMIYQSCIWSIEGYVTLLEEKNNRYLA